MRKSEFKDLVKVVELLRKQLHADLDAAFVEAVVHAEEENAEDDAGALRAIEAALKTALAGKGSR